MRRVEVTNLSKETVTRAGRDFPPTSTTAVMVSDSGLKEVRACIHLKVVEPSSKANKPQGDYICPYCLYTCPTRRGMTAHVRQQHPERYKEYRAE